MTNRPMRLHRNDADRVAKEDRVFHAIAPFADGCESVPVAAIAKQLNMGFQAVQDILLDLQLMGCVVQLQGRYRYRLVAGMAPAAPAASRWEPSGFISAPSRERLMGKRA